jgi:molecular chaperone GrpE (heat shock protein)
MSALFYDSYEDEKELIAQRK